jgi:tetratricopeptide (TPR) repeat protein
MLNPRFGVVTFTGREREQAQLAMWRDAVGSRLSARWLHGPGGQGKTRLAARFAEQSLAEGWKVVSVVHGSTGILRSSGSQDMRSGEATGLLAIVDYADRWPASHLTWLFSNTAFHQDVPTRLLLLGRSVSPWAAVRAALEDLAADTDHQVLESLRAGPEMSEREQMFSVARHCFANRYGIQGQVAQPSGTLDQPGFGLTLTLHMAALVTVDAQARGVSPPVDIDGLSAYLLNRERKHWTNMYQNRLEGLEFESSPEAMNRVVFTAAISGATSYTKGAALVRSLSSEVHPDRLLADHAACYPPSEAGEVLEPLYPDRLAEDFLALTLPGHSVSSYQPGAWASADIAALAARQQDGSPPAYVTRMLQFLASAAAPGRWRHVAGHLEAILGADPALAVEAGSSVLSAIAEVSDLDSSVFDEIERNLPSGRQIDLDVGMAAITARVVSNRLPNAGHGDSAWLCNLLAWRLGNAGDRRGSLAAIEEATAIRRALARDGSSAALADLAEALTGLSVALAAVTRKQDALAAAEEATRIYRGLAQNDPHAYLVSLALCLTQLGDCLAETGREADGLVVIDEALAMELSVADEMRSEQDTHRKYEYWRLVVALTDGRGKHLASVGRGTEALEIMESSVDLARLLAREFPDQYLPGLAGTLTDVSGHLTRAGRAADALAMQEEAAALHRRLASMNPAAHNAGLARSLSILGGQLAAAGRSEEGLAAAEEAITLFRQLTKEDPAIFLPHLAATLGNAGMASSTAGRTADAIAFREESVSIYRKLALEDPVVGESDLVVSLHNLGRLLSDTGHMDAALLILEEAVDLGRRLAQTRSATRQKELALSLDSLGIHLMKTGRGTEALDVGQEAVVLHRELVRKDAGSNPTELVSALVNLGYRQLGMDQDSEALVTLKEAASLRKPASGDQDQYSQLLAMLLDNVGRSLWEKGSLPDSVTALTEAVAVHRVLAEKDPDRHLSDFATALADLGTGLWNTGLREDALPPAREAVAILRRLSASDAGYVARYAKSLDHLAVCLGAGERFSEALAVSNEAVGVFQGLVEADPDAHRGGLASALNNLAGIASGLGRIEESLIMNDQACVLFRQLSRTDPVTNLPPLARALGYRVHLLSELGRQDDALSATEQCAEIYIQLVDLPSRTDPTEQELAAWLSHLGEQLSAGGRHEKALTATGCAAKTVRRLAAEGHQVTSADEIAVFRVHAVALDDAGMAWRETGRIPAAIDACRKSAAIFARIGDEYDVAIALENLGIVLLEARRYVEAIEVAQQAVDIFSVLHKRRDRTRALCNLRLAKQAYRRAHRQ